jgi:S1-C subfamily serine protease
MILAEENEINTNQTVSVAGYPAGNLGVTYGVIQELLNTSSRNIYDMGVVPRNIYVLQTYVKQGSSGGPVVLPSGKVAGMIFSRSTKFSNYAFAQKSDQLKEIILYESNNTRRVGTGYCFSD